MKRWPLIASFVLFIALCATLAYWAMQFFTPPVRQVAAPPPSVQAPPNIDAAASLFGGKGSTAVASNFQLKGVIMAGNPADSVVILAADGKPAQAIRVNREIAPGVKVQEVNRGYVVLLDNGVEKRVELPEDSKLASGIANANANAAPVATAPMPARPAPAMPATVVNGSATSRPSAASPSPAEPASNAATSPEVNDEAPPAPAPQSSGAGTSAGSSAPGGAAQASRAAAPASSPASPPTAVHAPGAGMGSPPITNQGSLAGSANPPAPATPSAPAARVAPGMPVTPQPARP
jgi:general secretion pathway protein C